MGVATIKDIAKDTKLSLATISKYLNGKNILPENKILIEESIKKLGYVPNKTAQNLRSKRHNTICILLPTIGDYFWGHLCSLIEENIRKNNYSTIIASYDSASEYNAGKLQLLISKQIDGMILVPGPETSAELPILLQKENIPFVCLDQAIKGVSTDLVTSANSEGSYNATKCFLDNGHRILGIIAGDFLSYTAAERLAGFSRACDEYRIPEKDRYIYNGTFSAQSGAECFREMMKTKPLPTAVLICGYNMTLGAILTLNDLGIKIPYDVSLISFDDDQIFSAFEPPITAVVQNTVDIADQACELLLKRISGNFESFPEKRMIETHLIIRKSVDLK